MVGEVPYLGDCDALRSPYSIYYLFLLDLVVPGPSDMCLSVINSLSPSFGAKFMIFYLEYIR